MDADRGRDLGRVVSDDIITDEVEAWGPRNMATCVADYSTRSINTTVRGDV